MTGRCLRCGAAVNSLMSLFVKYDCRARGLMYLVVVLEYLRVNFWKGLSGEGQDI
jgi:hypothetical protein